MMELILEQTRLFQCHVSVDPAIRVAAIALSWAMAVFELLVWVTK
jgi:hypothetical protein